MKRSAVLATILGLVVVGGAVASSALGLSMFQGASEGVPVFVEVVPLPPLADPTGSEGDLPLLPRSPKCDVFAPTTADLLGGNVLITSEAQMRLVWGRLFAEPYDEDLFDFDETFVVFMGSGLLLHGESFGISRAESFDGIFTGPDPKFPETYLEPSLAVISETFVPGVPPPPDHQPEYLVSAVKIDRIHLQNVIFHRSFFYGA
jgi:hypothetical protein